MGQLEDDLNHVAQVHATCKQDLRNLNPRTEKSTSLIAGLKERIVQKRSEIEKELANKEKMDATIRTLKGSTEAYY